MRDEDEIEELLYCDKCREFFSYRVLGRPDVCLCIKEDKPKKEPMPISKEDVDSINNWAKKGRK